MGSGVCPLPHFVGKPLDKFENQDIANATLYPLAAMSEPLTIETGVSSTPGTLIYGK